MENTLFEQTKVSKAYLTLSLPVVLSMMVSLVYNMVDTYFIALTNVTELVAGVSLAAPIFTMLIAFGDIFGLGGSSLISRLFGEKKEKEAKQASSFCFWISIVFGLFITMILLIFRNPILSMLGVESSTLKYASSYYTMISIGAPAIILGLVPSNILRTEGLAKEAMTGSIIGSIINIILDPLFIFVLKQGAGGAAIATVIGNIIADFYYAYIIMNKSIRLSIHISDIKLNGQLPTFSMISQILMIGIPASITNLMQSLMLMMTNKSLLVYGTDKIAAFGIAMKINMITAMILVGFAFGGQPLVGYNYGAKNRQRLKEILRFAYTFLIIVALVLSILISILAPTLISIFMNDSHIIMSGTSMLRYQQLGMIFMAICLVTTCVCQSVGNAFGAFVLSISRQGVIYFIVLTILSTIFKYNGILMSQAISDLLTALIAIFFMIQFIKKEHL